MIGRKDSQLTLRVEVEHWPLRTPFRITGQTMLTLDAVVVTLEADGQTGRGEAAGVDYLGDDIPRMLRQIEQLREAVESGINRSALQRLLPPGGARNALDCALWELEAKRASCAVWQLAGLDEPRPLLTTCTVGADDPAAMAAGARGFAAARAIKLKLTGEPVDALRVRAVRAARPDVWLAIDGNQGFDGAHLQALLPALTEARVQLIEQPFAVGSEPTLAALRSPIPIAADESAQGSSSLASLVGRFDIVNIKLDKCGGLTEGLMMAREALGLGLRVMIGNMIGTSLAMAPACLVGQFCAVVDLDGPLLLSGDRPAAAVYEDGCIRCDESVWGGIRQVRA